MTDYLNPPLLRLAAFQEANRKLNEAKGPVRLSGCVESQKVHIMATAGNSKTRLVVTYSPLDARHLFEDFRFFTRNVLLFPEKDLLFYQADIKSNEIVSARMKVFRALLECHEDPEKELVVVTSMAAVMNILPPYSRFSDRLIRLYEGQTVEIPALQILLTSLGYERVAKVENPGEFATHGGILDIFDLTSDLPCRIEFWDNEIDTIRTFSPESQLSGDRLEGGFVVYPATELMLTTAELEAGYAKIRKEAEEKKEAYKNQDNLEAGAALQNLMRSLEDEAKGQNLRGALERFFPYFYDETDTLPDYFPKGSVFALDEPARMIDQGNFVEKELAESLAARLEKGLALSRQYEIIRTPSETMNRLETGQTLVFTGLDTKLPMISVRETYHIECQPAPSYQNNYQGLIADLKRYRTQECSVVLLCPSTTRGRRLAEELHEYGLKAYFEETPTIEVTPGTLLITRGNLHRGFVYPNLKFVLLTENDIFGGNAKKKKHHPAMENGQKIRSFSELSVGDYVVHENYGIGIYKGIRNLKNDNVARDYLEISYGSSGTLYIPVTNLDVVQKYASADAKKPHLNRLDTPEWKKTKTRVKAAVEEVAEDLVRLYAARDHGMGYEYAPDSIWQREFEEMFPFEETDDQLTAIDDVKKDMESGKIMDRLICGDVGFGKTEVAIRAAFKAVMEGKQVAYLVPTTILAQQHYNTFVERMANYPVTVELLSRFRTEYEQKSTLKNLKSGRTDIVIGTHRILSEDVHFKDLGLLIIDEEQRFGVKHKERIKQMKTNIDVLTLTATPIPRTLHMSMIGVRDMSVLSEPPQDRQAIQTYVMEYSEELVREAISREIGRGGQVYYVYNRVQDISEIAAKVQNLVPDAVVSYAHGKMSERELENRMLSFIQGEIDVLVSTTIIETGLDIPNVNTIIIHDAERYGLSQLYQLRGRVGRSTRQAYAFVMYRKNHALTEDSQKRLEAIRQFTELGSGIRIAMEDLEIRGAGTVLGNAQSGHMSLVGYDLYCKMLAEAVQTAKDGHAPEEAFETLLDVRVDAFVPTWYIPNESLKLEVYKKISFLQTEEDRQSLLDELQDRYGDVPRQVENLARVALLRAMAKSVYLSEVKGNETELRFKFVPFARVRNEQIPVLIEKMDGKMRFLPGETPGLLWNERDFHKIGKKPVLDVLEELLSTIKELLI